MSGPGKMTASEISEMLLEKSGRAILENDFDAFAEVFAVPHMMETPDQKITLKTRDALHTVFEKLVQNYADKNVTTLIRWCEVAEFRGPLKVEATHVSHVMAGNLRVADPFHGFSVIEFFDNRWQLISTQYAVDQNNFVRKAVQTEIERNTSSPPLSPDFANRKKETRQ